MISAPNEPSTPPPPEDQALNKCSTQILNLLGSENSTFEEHERESSSKSMETGHYFVTKQLVSHRLQGSQSDRKNRNVSPWQDKASLGLPHSFSRNSNYTDMSRHERSGLSLLSSDSGSSMRTLRPDSCPRTVDSLLGSNSHSLTTSLTRGLLPPPHLRGP